MIAGRTAADHQVLRERPPTGGPERVKAVRSCLSLAAMSFCIGTWVSRLRSRGPFGVSIAPALAALVSAAWTGVDGSTHAAPPDAPPHLTLVGEGPDAAPPAGRPNPAGRPVRLTLHWENDGGWYKPNRDTDRHYTNGTGLSVSFQPGWLERSLGGGGPQSTAAGLTVGQLLFTPDDITVENPGPDDHPYASYFYVGGFVQREQAGALDHLQVDVGMIGPSTRGEQVQEWVHRVTGSPDPEGWDAQLGDEFTYQLTYRRRHRVELATFGAWGRDGAVQLIPSAELRLGNVYRSAGLGVVGRVGFNLPDDYGPSMLRDIGSFTSPDFATSGSGWWGYGFVGLSGRYNEWNTFIEGSNRRDPSPSVSLVPWTGELQVGAVLGFRGGRHDFTGMYSQVFLTDTFREQTTRDAHASWTLSWTYRF